MNNHRIEFHIFLYLICREEKAHEDDKQQSSKRTKKRQETRINGRKLTHKLAKWICFMNRKMTMTTTLKMKLPWMAKKLSDLETDARDKKQRITMQNNRFLGKWEKAIFHVFVFTFVTRDDWCCEKWPETTKHNRNILNALTWMAFY